MKKTSDILLSVCIFLFIIGFSVVVTLNFRSLYEMNVENENLAEISGYSKEQIINSYNNLIDYNMIFNNSQLEFDGIEMSNEGRIHFEEVKNIFVGFQIITIIAGLISAFGIVYKLRKKEIKFLFFSSIFTVTIPVVLGSIIAINWQWCFITFHKIAFRNDYWIFDPAKDPIITVLPDSFFMQCAIMIVSIAFTISTAMFAVWYILKRKEKENN